MGIYFVYKGLKSATKLILDNFGLSEDRKLRHFGGTFSQRHPWDEWMAALLLVCLGRDNC